MFRGGRRTAVLPPPAPPAAGEPRPRAAPRGLALAVRLLPAAGVLAAIAGLAAWPAGAEDAASPATRAAVHAVIARQIEAFRRDDGTAAFALASPHIQALFGSADGFMAMVRHAYQPVYRPESVTFGPIGSDHGHVTQDVDLIGPDGRAARAHYTMEREKDGSWRIDGCALTLGDYVGT